MSQNSCQMPTVLSANLCQNAILWQIKSPLPSTQHSPSPPKTTVESICQKKQDPDCKLSKPWEVAYDSL